MTNQCTNDEHSKLLRITNFRFPNSYKRVGLIGAALIFVFLLGYKFYGENLPLVKDICRTVMLLFLLVASTSKEVLEDEYIRHVRSQSYIIAFICAIAYSLIIPLVAIVLDVLITTITSDGVVNFHETSAFEVIFMLVCFQILFFEVLKRFGRA